jgi:hypothetical protein
VRVLWLYQMPKLNFSRPGELQSDADIEELRNQLDAFEPPYPEDENEDSEVGQAAQSGKPAAQSNDESNDDAARSGDPAARSDKSSSDDDFNPSEDESKDSSKSSSKDESAESSDGSDSDGRPKPKSRCVFLGRLNADQSHDAL